MSRKNLLVMYHSPCMDGYGAACAFNDQVNKSDWTSITYYPCDYKLLEELPFMVGNNPLSGITHVLCLDICPTPKTLDYMLVGRGVNVCILDHHDTAMDNLENYEKAGLLYTITEEFSGASMVRALGSAVNFVFGQDVVDGKYHDDHGVLTNNEAFHYLDSSLITNNKLFTLLEVRDLWLKGDPELKKQADDLAAYFKETKIASSPIRPIAELEALIDEGLIRGRELNAQQETIILAAIDKSVTWDIEVDGANLSVLVGECPSELGSVFGGTYNDSVDGNSLAIGTYSDGTGIAGLSLRSKGSVGYARIVAEQLGGGGHDHASGVGFKSNKPATREALIDMVNKALTV